MRIKGIESGGGSRASILDIEGTLARLGGDQQLFVEITAFLLEDAPLLLSKLRSAVAAGDADAIERNAHSLKGLLLNSGGVRAANAAQSLEDAGRAGDTGKSEHHLETLEAEVDALTKAIHERQQPR